MPVSWRATPWTPGALCCQHEALLCGDVEKEKVLGGLGVVGLQAWTLLSTVPLALQWAEMQPPRPSVVE